MQVCTQAIRRARGYTESSRARKQDPDSDMVVEGEDSVLDSGAEDARASSPNFTLRNKLQSAMASRAVGGNFSQSLHRVVLMTSKLDENLAARDRKATTTAAWRMLMGLVRAKKFASCVKARAAALVLARAAEQAERARAEADHERAAADADALMESERTDRCVSTVTVIGPLCDQYT